MSEMDPGNPVESGLIIKVVESLAKALHYLHVEQKLLHGDVKSANVLIKGDFEEVKLCDFGVSLKLKDDLTLSEDEKGEFVGTGPWTPSEALDEEGLDISHKSDIFSLGCLIYEMLALQAPHVDLLPTGEDDDDDDDDEYDDEEYQEALGTRPKLPLGMDFDADEYKKIIAVFHACTEEDPKMRPSAETIIQAIKA